MTIDDMPLEGLTFSVVGPGRVGSSLGRWLAAAGARLVDVAGRDPAPADRLVEACGGRRRRLEELTTADQDLLLMAVPEGALAEVAAALARRPQAAVALHTAGALDAGVLAPLRTGSAVGTFHPLRAFPRILAEPGEAARTLFTIDGDEAATDLAARLAGALGTRAVPVSAAARPVYHLAATLAAGGVVTLLAVAAELARRAGLGAEIVEGYHRLAAEAIAEAAAAEDPADAVTGPAARADRAALAAQGRALEAVAPHLAGLVATLAGETLRQRQRRGDLDENARRLLEDLDKVNDLNDLPEVG